MNALETGICGTSEWEEWNWSSTTTSELESFAATSARPLLALRDFLSFGLWWL